MANDNSNSSTNNGDKKPVPTPRTEDEIRAMAAKQYMDEMIVPTLLKALSAVNKQRPTDPIDFLGKYLVKVAADPSAFSTSDDSKPGSASATPTPASSVDEEKMQS